MTKRKAALDLALYAGKIRAAGLPCGGSECKTVVER
jgi:hypothetical protein